MTTNPPDQTTAEQLPPLPESIAWIGEYGGDVFTDQQMQAYARQAIAALEAENERLRAALQKIIDMNIQYCKDKYGDASRAESMGCVSTARAAMKEQTP